MVLLVVVVDEVIAPDSPCEFKWVPLFRVGVHEFNVGWEIHLITGVDCEKDAR
jgi:hypothetical protein